MEAGYDYLLINRRTRTFRRLLPLGGVVVVLGLIGVLVWGLLTFVFDGSADEPDSGVASVQATPEPAQTPVPITQTSTPAPTVVPIAPVQATVRTPPPTPVPELPSDLARAGMLYPGASVKAADWADLFGARGPTTLIDVVPWGDVTPAAVGSLSAPTRLIIPGIDVDSTIQQLSIVDLGNSRGYETPNNVVGHLPGTANPGEAGSVWLFGNLESPLSGVGVFAQLPELPGRLRRPEAVYAVVENGTESYRYRLFDSQVIPQEQFNIDYLEFIEDGTAQLFLVTAVPRGTYDQRLVVRGVLDGVRG